MNITYKDIIICALTFLVCLVSIPKQAIADQSIGERFQTLRWLEDYSNVGAAELSSGPLAQLKRLSLSDNAYPYLTLGGDYRLRYEDYDNELFGLRGSTRTSTTLQRFMLHGDLQLQRGRIFIQLSDFEEQGRQGGPGPVDESKLDVQQAFIDWTPAFGRVRVGRQELVLGSGLKTGLREGPNQRRSFDSVRVTVKDTDVFYAREVSADPDTFADSSSDGAQLYGVYGNSVLSWKQTIHLDLFYYGFEREAGVFNQGTDDEKRHSLGFRAQKNKGPLQFEYEATYQFGRFGSSDISAWGIATDTSYGWDHGWAPRVGLRLGSVSGDSDSADDKLGTYNALFPNPAYASKAAQFAPSNVRDVQPYILFYPHNKLHVRAGLNFVSRQSSNDAIYTTPGVPLIESDVSNSRDVATLYNLTAVWTPTPYITIQGLYVNSQAGDFIRDAGGRDSEFYSLSLALRF